MPRSAPQCPLALPHLGRASLRLPNAFAGEASPEEMPVKIRLSSMASRWGMLGFAERVETICQAT